MGLAWIFAPEPWLLDKSANEILLQTTYKELFLREGNEFLKAYLQGLYGFFGLWIFSVGLMIVVYVKATGLDTERVRKYIYLTLVAISTGAYILIVTYIPTSYFLWVNHGVIISVVISFLFSRSQFISRHKNRDDR